MRQNTDRKRRDATWIALGFVLWAAAMLAAGIGSQNRAISLPFGDAGQSALALKALGFATLWLLARSAIHWVKTYAPAHDQRSQEAQDATQ